MKVFTTISRTLLFPQKPIAPVRSRNHFLYGWVFLAFFFSMLQGYGQNALDQIGVSSNPQAFVAYSLRKVSSAYTGPAVRVRRASDNAEADVAFDGTGKVSGTSVVTVAVAGGSLSVGNTLTFSTFVSGTDGFVTRWYNQALGSGANFASNTNKTGTSSVASQPRIVKAGTYLGYLENISETANTGVSLSGPISGFTNNSAFTLLAAYKKFNPTTTANQQMLSTFYNLGVGGSMRYWHGVTYVNAPVSTRPLMVSRPSSTGQQLGLVVPVALDDTKPLLISSTQSANSSNDAGVSLYVNDVSVGAFPYNVISNFTATSFNPINSLVNSSVYVNIQMYEMIVLNSKLSATDLTAAQTNIFTTYPVIKAGYPMAYYPTTVTSGAFNTFTVATNSNVSLTPSYYPNAATATSFAVSPALPNGMSINATTGVISGAPTVPSDVTQYTITATNANGSWPAQIGFQVVNPPAGLTYPTPKTFEVGVPITTLTASSTGGAINTYSSSTLPAGLSLNNLTGDITGTPTVSSAATNYTITGTNAAGTTSTVLNIAVNPAFQPGTVTGGGSGGLETVCAGITPTTIGNTNSASGGIGTISYQWEMSVGNQTSFTNISGATGVSYSPPAQNFANTTSVYFRRGASTPNNAKQYSNVHTVQYLGVLSITKQPTGATLCNNTTAGLYVDATAPASNTYQWFSNSSASTVGATAVTTASVSNQTFTPTATTTASTVYYYAVVVKTSCGTSVTSNFVPFTTLPVLSIQTQPLSTQTVCNNVQPAALSAVVAGGSLSYTYEWYFNTTGLNSGGTLVATSAAYTVPATSTAGDRYFYVVVKDAVASGCSVTSNVSKVTTNAVLAISTQPTSIQTVCNNVQPAALSVVATGGGSTYTYQWYANTTNNNTGGTPITLNATSASYTVPATTTGGNAYYYVAVTAAGGCGTITSAYSTITTKSAIAIASLSPDVTVCNNTIANLSVSAAGGSSSYTYEWFSNTTQSNVGGSSISPKVTTAAYTVPATLTAGARYYYVVVTDAGSCGSVTSTAVAVTTKSPMSISTQPLATQTLCNNVTGTLSVTTTGGTTTLSPTYQWFSHTSNSNTGGVAISLNGTAASYTVPATTTGGVRYYYVEVTDGGGCNSVTSTVAVVNTRDPLTIGTQPQGSQTICNNVTGTLSVAAAGASGTYSYQWYVNTVNSNAGGTPISLNGTAASYTVPATTTAGNRYYYVVVKDDVCSQSLTSTASVVVTRQAVAIGTQPLSQITCNNTVASLSVSATGGTSSYLYQWFSNMTQSNVGGSSVTLQLSSAAYSVPATLTAGARYYYVVVTDAGSCGSVTSTAVAVTTKSPMSISTQPLATQTLCNNVTGTLSVTTTGGTTTLSPTYQWFSNTSNSNTGGVSISLNGTAASYTVPATTTGGVRYYYVEVTDGGGCNAVTSTVAVVNTRDPLSINTQPQGSQTICNNVTGTLSVAGAGASGTYSYQWYSNTTNSNTGGTPISLNSTAASYTVPATTTAGNRYYYVVIKDDVCSQSLTSTASVVVTREAVAIGTQPLSQITCNNTVANLSVAATGGTSSYLYQWFSNTMQSNVGGSSVTPQLTSAGYSVPATLTVGDRYYYVVVTDAGSCGSVTSTAVTVTTKSQLSISTQPLATQTLCNNVTGTLSVTTTGGTTTLSPTYQWFSNTSNSNTGGTSISLNGTAASYTVPATTTGGVRYYYVEVTDGGGCNAVTSTVAVVNTRAPLSINTQPQGSQTICNNVTGTLSVAGAGASGTYSYQWYSNTTNSNTGGTPISLNSTAASYTVPATTTAGNRYYYVVIKDDVCNQSLTSTASVVVTREAVAIGTQPLSQITCNNVTVDITTSGTGGSLSYTYQWYSNTSNSNTGGDVILGETAATFSVPASSVVNEIRYYYAEVRDALCLVSVVSQPAKITTGDVFSITSQPISQEICNNSTVDVSVAVSGGSLSHTYQWYANTVNSNTGGTPVSLNGTSATYTVPATATGGERYYYALITESSCGQILTTNPVTIKTRPVLTVGTQPVQTLVCNNTTKDITVSGAGGSGVYQYQWYSSATNSNTLGTNLGGDDGANTDTYTIPATTIAGDRFYYVEIKDVGCSESINTTAFTVTTGEVLAVAVQPLVQTICNGSESTLSALASGGTGVYTYQWFRPNGNTNVTGVNLGSASGAQTASYTVPAVTLAGDRYFYVSITDAGCSTLPVKSIPAKITTGNALTVGTQPVSSQVCYNTTATITTAGAGSSLSYTYQWYSNTSNSNSGGTQILSATGASYEVPATTTAGDRYYYAVIKDANCNLAIVTDVVTINTRAALQVSTQPVSQTICNQTSTNLVVAVQGASGDYTFQWMSNGSNSNAGGTSLESASGANTTTYTVPATGDAGNRYYYAVITDRVCNTSVTTTPVTITTRSALAIGVQPQPLTVLINNTTTALTTAGAGASGSYTYQWYEAPANSAITGATANTYNVPPTTTSGSRFFYAVITDANCLNQVNTAQAEVVTSGSLVITAQPLSQTVCNNTSTVLSVTASGGTSAFSYQWYSNVTNSISGASLISGANAASYTVPASQLVTDRYYFVVIGDINLGNTVTSEIAKIITRAGTPVVVNRHPAANTAICVNGTVSLETLGAGGASGSFVYQWYSNTIASTSNGTPIAGETSAIFSNTFNTNGTYYYYATVADPSCGSPVVSNVAKVQVNDNPSVSISPATQVVCKDDAAFPINAVVSGGAGTLNYQWYSNTSNTVVGGTDLGASDGARTASFTPPSTTIGNLYYFVKASFTGNGCVAATSNIHTTTVNQVAQPSDIVITTPTPTLCKGLSTTLHAALASGSTILNPVFTWYADANLTQYVYTGTDFTTPVLNSSTTYYVKVSGSNACENVAGNGQSQTITVAAQAPEVVLPSNVAYCAGLATSPVVFSSTISGTTYTWSNDNTAAGLIANGTGDVPSFTGVNNSLANVVLNIQVTPFANGCTGVTKSYPITILPNAHVADTALVICGGTSVTYTPVNVPAGKKYSWIVASVPAGISGATNNAVPQTSFSQTLVNNTNTAQEVVYTVTPDGCSDRSFTLTVTVNPVPQIGNQSIPAAICYGAGFRYADFAGIVPAGTQYTWTSPSSLPFNAITGGNGQGAKQDAVSEASLYNSLSTVVSTAYTVTPYSSAAFGSCAGQPFTFTVPVNPKPLLTLTNAGSICNNTMAVFSPSSLTPGVTYAWRRNTTDNISNPAASGVNGFSEVLHNTASYPVLVSYEYTLTVNGCSNSQIVQVLVYPDPILNSAKDLSVCSGALFSYTPSSLTNGTSFTWSRQSVAGIRNTSNSGSGDIFEALVNTTQTPVTVTYHFTLVANGCSHSEDISVTVNPIPSVAESLDQVVCNGSQVQAVFSGSSIAGTAYNWTNTNTNVGLASSGSGNISFAAVNRLSLAQTAAITVTPVANGCSGTPKNFNFVISPTPALSSSITPPAVCSNAAFTYVPESNTDNTSFSWSRAAVNGISNPAASGSGIITETLVNTTGIPVQVPYQILLSANGCVARKTIYVTVNPTPSMGAVANQVFCNNSIAVVNFSRATVNGTVYSWTNTNTELGVAAAGSGDIFFMATNTKTSPITGTITVIPEAGGCQGTPVVFSMKISPSLGLTNADTLTPVCSGSPIVFTPTVDGDTSATVSWTRPSVYGISNKPATGKGSINETLINTTASPILVTYAITIANNQCSNKQNISVVVNPAISIVNAVSGLAICSNEVFLFSPNTGVAGTQFKWTRAAVSGIANSADSSSGDISEILVNTTHSPIDVVYKYSMSEASACSNDQEIRVTVKPLPQLLSANTQVVCSGTPVYYLPVSNLPGTVFTWTRSATTGISNVVASGLGTISESLVNPTAQVVPVSYALNMTGSNGCAASTSLTVAVKPVPTVRTLADQSVCKDGRAQAVQFTGDLPNTVFNWTNSIPAIGLVASGTGNIASFTAANPGTTTLTAYIDVTPELDGCKGAPVTVLRINVNPGISTNFIESAPASACPGQLVGPLASTYPTGGDGINYTYQWLVSAEGLNYTPLVASGSSNRRFYAPAQTRDTWYKMQVSSGGCSSISDSVKVKMGAKPAITLYNRDNYTISIGNTTQVIAQGATNWQWTPRSYVSDPFIPNPLLGPVADTKYTVTGTNDDGCSDTASVTVRVVQGYSILPNNVLTPNGDGYNDTWEIKNIKFYPSNEIVVFNRNGVKVRTLTDYTGGWTGTSDAGAKLATDVYYYVIKLKSATGEVVWKGHINIFN